MATTKTATGTRALPDAKQSKKTTKTPSKRSKNKASSSTPSRLLELAPELRNNIFRYAIISNEPIKLQFHAIRGTTRRRFTTIPGLLRASKQLRLETQRLFVEENEFEISPEVLKLHGAAPLTLFRTMHRNVGLELRSVHVCQEIQKRVLGNLFQLKASFTVSKHGAWLAVTDQVYSAALVGKSSSSRRAATSIRVCGCNLKAWLVQYREVAVDNDIVEFLTQLKTREAHRTVTYNAADMSRSGGVVYSLQSYHCCRSCGSRGLYSFEF